jgi:Na+:H+ antiporter, NhaA family
LVLLAAAAAALVWANFAFESYEALFASSFGFDLGPLSGTTSFHAVINDGLMVIFFFVVGVEIKRELVEGELADRRKAMLPAVGALGGMLVPALIYLLLVGAGGEAGRGWGVPMATDIAFAVGVVSLLGRRVPDGAKLFLLTLAIADDIGAIAVIALFYTDDLKPGLLLVAALGLVAVGIARRRNLRSWGFYVPLAVVVWLVTLGSGVHATVAGVALGMSVPAFNEFRLGLLASYVVIPLFALANAGIYFGDTSIGSALTSPVGLGVALGLVFGKLVGIALFTTSAIRFGWGRLPTGMNGRHLAGVSVMAGIGFTVALFVVSLAFTDPELVADAKVGIFAASVVAGLSGYLVLRSSRPAT